LHDFYVFLDHARAVPGIHIITRVTMKQLLIHRQWCKGCRICVVFCPKDVLGIDSEDKVYSKNPENCIFCGLCGLRCPDLAIDVRETSGNDEVTCGWTAAASKE